MLEGWLSGDAQNGALHKGKDGEAVTCFGGLTWEKLWVPREHHIKPPYRITGIIKVRKGL